MEHILNDGNAAEVLNSSLPVVLDFSATWCGPCKKIAPMISELAEEYDGRVEVCKCDVDECEELAMQFGIRSVPTVVFLKEGKEVSRTVGAQAKNVFVERIEALL